MGDRPTNVIAVTSGKGGVGKTSVAVNLAVACAQMGDAVLLLDADLGLANVDVALGLRPRRDLSHVMAGECGLADILIEGPAGIRIVPASSGVARMADLGRAEHAGLVQAFSELEDPIDTFIVDTGAGIDTAVLTFASACQQVLVVICDEPTSMADAYALIKVLHTEAGVGRFQILANMVESEVQGRRLFEKLLAICERFLDVGLSYVGSVPSDPYLRKAVRSQCAVVLAYPRSPAAQAFKAAAIRVRQSSMGASAGGGITFFVERFVEHRFGTG